MIFSRLAFHRTIRGSIYPQTVSPITGRMTTLNFGLKLRPHHISERGGTEVATSGIPEFSQTCGRGSTCLAPILCESRRTALHRQPVNVGAVQTKNLLPPAR